MNVYQIWADRRLARLVRNELGEETLDEVTSKIAGETEVERRMADEEEIPSHIEGENEVERRMADEEEIPSHLEESSDFGAINLPFGTTIVWSGDLSDYLDSTNRQVGALDGDILRSASLPADFLSSWHAFKDEWAQFYTAEKGSTHILDVVEKMNAVDTYVDRLKGYQTKMKGLGVAVNTPDIIEDPASTYNPANKKSLSPLAWLGIGATAAIGGIVLVKHV